MPSASSWYGMGKVTLEISLQAYAIAIYTCSWKLMGTGECPMSMLHILLPSRGMFCCFQYPIIIYLDKEKAPRKQK